MAIDTARIPREIEALNLPDIERVILAGSGVLELLGIRVARDIDLVTTRRNTDFLLESDPSRWQKKVHTFKRIRDGGTFQKTSIEDVDSRFDIWHHWYHAGRPVGNRIMYIDELTQSSWQHDAGFRVLHHSLAIEIKAASALEKNLLDVARYHEFMNEKEKHKDYCFLM